MKVGLEAIRVDLKPLEASAQKIKLAIGNLLLARVQLWLAVRREMEKMDCPIKLNKVHCQSCYFLKDGRCQYGEIVKERSHVGKDNNQ